MTSKFDAFLSHQASDRTAAGMIAEALSKSGAKVWLAEQQILAGEQWFAAIQGAIENSSSFVVLKGAEGITRWQAAEVQVALSRHFSDSGRTAVVVLLLPGASAQDLPPFLQLFAPIVIKSWAEEHVAAAMRQVLTAIGRTPEVPISNAQPIPRVFLCHAKEDDQIVKRLYFKLREFDIDPWYDKEKLTVGDRWEREIEIAIEATDFFAICLSRRSVQKRGFIQREIKLAIKEYQRRPLQLAYLLPVRLEDCVVPEMKLDDMTRLSELHWLDLFEQDDASLGRFAEGIRRQFARGRET
ncbi:toll/interleukin-1 receptor domain-containing protein [Zoogloea sp.]|uniref:toll/interleukin-1 receptor domain-containing protein n=1 Tax=Zoogloea sp. TaxID=49181 RepID=UPI0035B44E4D